MMKGLKLTSVLVFLLMVLDTVSDRKVNIFTAKIQFYPHCQCPLQWERLALNGKCRREVAAQLNLLLERMNEQHLNVFYL